MEKKFYSLKKQNDYIIWYTFIHIAISKCPIIQKLFVAMEFSQNFLTCKLKLVYSTLKYQNNLKF